MEIWHLELYFSVKCVMIIWDEKAHFMHKQKNILNKVLKTYVPQTTAGHFLVILIFPVFL